VNIISSLHKRIQSKLGSDIFVVCYILYFPCVKLNFKLNIASFTPARRIIPGSEPDGPPAPQPQVAQLAPHWVSGPGAQGRRTQTYTIVTRANCKRKTFYMGFVFLWSFCFCIFRPIDLHAVEQIVFLTTLKPLTKYLYFTFQDLFFYVGPSLGYFMFLTIHNLWYWVIMRNLKNCYYFVLFLKTCRFYTRIIICDRQLNMCKLYNCTFLI
jgi:hypothetical protein